MKIIIGVIALMVFVYGCATEPVQSGNTVPDDSGATIVVDNPPESENMDDTKGETVTFVLSGENFRFLRDGAEAPTLRVKEGDTVRIEFTSIDGFHDWGVDEFDAVTERVNTGGSTVVEFVADKKGTFEYYCSVGSHRAQGMYGNIIVE